MSDEPHDLKAKFDRLTALYHVSQVLHSTLDPEQAMQLIITEAVRLMRASSGSVVLINPTSGFMEILAAQGLPGAAAELRLRVGEGITGWVARTGKPARVGDVSRDRRYVMLRPDVSSELAVPLEVKGEVRGVLNVDSERLDAFSLQDQELLEALAIEASRVIQNTWHFEQLRLKAGLLESLASVSQAISSALHLDDALGVITREACRLMGARMAALRMLDASREWLDLRASHGAGETYLRMSRLSVEDSLIGIVVRRKKPIQTENVQLSTRYQSVEVARQEELFGLLSVPLLYGGEVIGVLSVYTAKPYSFSNDQVRILSALAELSAIAIEKARLYERVVDVEEQLRQNEKLSALGLLAAEVAHEIRNPLTVMKMLYHSLRLQFPANDPRTKDARIIGEKMEHLNRIVEQILDFARTTEPQFSLVNLNELIKELGLLVRHKLKNQNIELVQNLDANLPDVPGEATQLEQAFLNLILNAAEAMPKGGKLTITARAVRGPRTTSKPAFVSIEFHDTGEGMTEEQQSRAFKSVLKTSKRRGSGFGLAIVARVIDNHRGKIKLKSEVGRGTTVSILLPV